MELCEFGNRGAETRLTNSRGSPYRFNLSKDKYLLSASVILISRDLLSFLNRFYVLN